ncbi:MAG: signal peptidase I [Clostridia bacterium]|nr:signal peptidase I [Clostridium sp.]MBS6253044.1 signal peptidase I [Clostridium sp.]
MNPKIKEALEWVYCIIIAIVLALLFRYFIGTPTIVKQVSMYPTLVQDQRLWLNRWGRTTKTLPERGDIITFEAPSKKIYAESEVDQSNPIAKYEDEPTNILGKFTKYVLEIGKESYIKRVIALPGEHVQIKNGKVYINDKELEEKYLQEGIVTDVVGAGLTDFIVPENCVFAMGDNRSHSTDCRAFGCIPLEKIESKVAIRIWPLNVWGKVE